MYRQRIILFFSIIIPFFVLTIGITYLLCIKYPRYVQHNEYYTKTGFNIKEHRCETLATPKILIVSGSNSLMGICTPLLEKKTNSKIVNFGCHSGLPLEIYFGIIKKHAKPHDIVIMPLEYGFYTRDKTIEDWVILVLTTWGTEFIQEFSSEQIIEIFFKSIPSIPQRIINYNMKFPICTYEEYIKKIDPTAIISKSFSHENIFNSYGDVLADHASILTYPPYYYFKVAELQDFRFQQLKELSEYLAKQNIQLLFTYPVSIQNPKFDLSNKEHYKKIETLNKKFKNYNLNFIGIPELSNFEFKFSYNTWHHLNAEGAILRTLYFADMINSYLAGKQQEISDMKEYKNQKKTEAKQILEEYRKLGNYSK